MKFQTTALMCLIGLALSARVVFGEPLALENRHVSVEIDRASGAVRSLTDKELNVTYPLAGIGFEVVTAAGTLRAGKALNSQTKDGEATLCFTGNGLEVTLHYSLGKEDRFVEKWLEIKAADGRPFFLESVVLEDVAASAFKEIHFHDDNTIWHCPINLFLRAEKGGCFAGLEYPYWELKQKGKEGFRLGYQPNYQVKAGEVNVSEKYFLGVYRKEGITRYSQGPYPGRRPTPYVSFDGTGLGQHFPGRKIPAAAVEAEELDWGEVWAMQAFMRHVLPELPLPEAGYWVWQNGWWAGLFNPNPVILDQLKAVGIHDIMTAHTWYGRGNHPSPEPYLSQMRIEPPGFPLDKAVAGLPGPAGPAAGWHSPQQVLLDQFKPDEFTPQFQVPPAMEQFIEAGRKLGVRVNSFALPGIWFDRKPEWGSRDAAGKPSVYLFGRKVSCPACDEYMQHLLALHEAVFDQYQPRWWGWDGRWLSYREVGGVGSDPCYANNHGHLPGDNRYKEWMNIQRFLLELRRKYPRMCLEQYYGLKRGGPWGMRYLNADEGYYETNGADMNRLQCWHHQNDRFRPVYKNYAAVFGKEAADFQFNVIATLSGTAYCQIGPGFKGLQLPENREFLKTWRAWASDNHAFLKVKRDLFDCPGFTPVDGSAHLIKDRGFIFLFPGGFDLNRAPTNVVRASIPLTRWVGLEENQEALYRIWEIYPREKIELGVYRYGETFLYDMPRRSAVVLSVEPAGLDSHPQRPELKVPGKDLLVVPAFAADTTIPRADVSPQTGRPAARNAAWAESARPVRPGMPGQAPFWNAPSHQFTYAPAFDFKPVAAAKSYRFTLNTSGKAVTFEAAEPWASLSPVWASVPVGPVTLKVEGLDQPGGTVLGKAGSRSFHRAAPYNGPYRPVKSAEEYRKSALLALQTMFSRQYFRDWMQPGVAPQEFRKNTVKGAQLQAYAYPSKLIGQLIAGSVLYAGSSPRPADADSILRIGEKAGELLASLHFPPGKAMEHFPPTYAAGAKDAPVTHVLMFMPAEAAEAYLDFYEATRDDRYLNAALAIANTYRKLQLPSGTWYQYAESERGGACYPTLLVPVTVLLFFDRLIEQYGKTEFKEVLQAALRWTKANTLKTYNWQSQFEDGKPNQPYGSLSPQQACEFAQYLFRHTQDDQGNLGTAIELLRFAEDQFVVWEKPPARPQSGALAPLSSDKWITPCVCEQHQYWMPVNYSFATLMRTYLAAFRATGEKRHLAKAADLGSTLLEVQALHKGEYPTYPVQPTPDGSFEEVQNVWFNCTVGTARAVLELSRVMEANHE